MSVIDLLNKLTALPDHQFWPDALSLHDAHIFQQGFLLGHRQITDAYLFSLAIYNKALLVTFDKGIRELDTVAASSHLWVLKQ